MQAGATMDDVNNKRSAWKKGGGGGGGGRRGGNYSDDTFYTSEYVGSREMPSSKSFSISFPSSRVKPLRERGKRGGGGGGVGRKKSLGLTISNINHLPLSAIQEAWKQFPQYTVAEIQSEKKIKIRIFASFFPFSLFCSIGALLRKWRIPFNKMDRYRKEEEGGGEEETGENPCGKQREKGISKN